MQKFVKYYRVSTRSQGQSGLGIEAQQRDVQLYLDNYLNEEHEVIATYTEIDSGSKENRIELSKAKLISYFPDLTVLNIRNACFE